MLANLSKNANDVLDYDIDFSRWLPSGDRIVNVQVNVNPVGAVNIDSVQIKGKIVKVWLSGGVNGRRCEITLASITKDGRVKNVSFNLSLKESS